LDLPILRGISANGFSLFAAVSLVYFFARSQNLPEIQAQTLAFTTWIVSHIILAFVSRSEAEPLHKLGFFSNRLMNLWALAVIAFLTLVLFVPVVAAQLKIGTISFSQFGIILAVSFVASFWQEIVKIIQFLLPKRPAGQSPLDGA
jgi:Ca2+-transporting ATPase